MCLPATGDSFRITHHLDFHCKKKLDLVIMYKTYIYAGVCLTIEEK